MPEESGESTGLVVNDTPASSTMEGVEEVEVVEAAGDGEMGEASEAKEEPSKKKGPSNMVSGWGKGAKKVAGKPGRVETPKAKERSQFIRRKQEYKRRFLEGVPERSKMTMFDLIYYNPENGPRMSIEEDKKEKRKRKRADWSEEETLKFYNALSIVGSDFSMMESIFKKRTRQELKLKFKKEERLNWKMVNKCLSERGMYTELEGVMEEQEGHEAGSKQLCCE